MIVQPNTRYQCGLKIFAALILSICFSSSATASTAAWESASTELDGFNTCNACHGLSQVESLITNVVDNGAIEIEADQITLDFNLDINTSGSGRYRIVEKNNTAGIADSISGFLQNLDDTSRWTIPISSNRKDFDIKYCVGQNLYGNDLGAARPRQIECGKISVTREAATPVLGNICVIAPSLCIIQPVDPCLINPGSCITLPNPENRPPVAQADSFDISEGSEPIVLDVLNNDSDPDGDPITIQLADTTTALGGNIVVFRNAVTYQPPSLLSQTDSFSYRIVDGDGLNSASVLVSLVPVDTDGDGITDTIDNCDLLSNVDQLDMDGDSIGDICDGDPDGDGTPGFSGESFASGRILAESECLSCHLIGTAGAPQFGDTVAWELRLSNPRGIEGLLESVTYGVAPVMPAFGSFYTAKELTEAIRYLSGIEDADGSGGSAPDLDLDGVLNGLDNCPRVANVSQTDSDGNGTGDVCEPDADVDRDGYRFDIDDNDSDANRLPSDSADFARSTIFISDNAMSLGSLATAVYQSNKFRDGKISLADEEFLAAATQIYAGVTPELDSQFVSVSGIISLDIREVSGSAELVVEMFGSVPLESDLRVYQPTTARWDGFNAVASGSDRLTSAPDSGGTCPIANSTSYTTGLKAGLSCVKIRVTDGGQNDADNQVNGRISLIMNIGSGRNTSGKEPPPDIDLRPKSGGGATHPWLMILLLMFFRRYRLKLIPPLN